MMDGWMYGYVDGLMDGWICGWWDGWMDGWICGWMDGWWVCLVPRTVAGTAPVHQAINRLYQGVFKISI